LRGIRRTPIARVFDAVADNALCASACALVWLGGKERFMGKNARIGFHAAREDDSLEVSSTGNAIVGAYLYQVGITDFRTITFITRARPDAMTWLTQYDARRCLFPFLKLFSLSEGQWAWARSGLEWVRRFPREHVDPVGRSIG
jgi:hypothetical protein